jgi:subtilisin-like proprotein convertase family protein
MLDVQSTQLRISDQLFDPFQIPVTTAPGVVRICNNSPVTIYHKGVASMLLNVAGIGPIGDVMVELGINHTYMKDLVVKLFAPMDAKSITLFARVCSGGRASNDPPLLFSDLALDGVRYGDYSPSTGYYMCSTSNLQMYAPNMPLTLLRGIDANGQWWLDVNDTASGDSGTIDYLCLHFLRAPPLRTITRTKTLSKCTRTRTRTLKKTSTVTKCTLTKTKTLSKFTTTKLKKSTKTVRVTVTITRS